MESGNTVINGEKLETWNSWTVASISLYEACSGNDKAIDLVTSLLVESNPLMDVTELLSRCNASNEGAIRETICLLAFHLNDKARK